MILQTGLPLLIGVTPGTYNLSANFVPRSVFLAIPLPKGAP